MDNELELAAMSLQFKFGFWIGLSSWQALLRLTLGWFSSILEKWMAGMVQEDRAWADGLLNKRAYRVTRSLLNVLASVKLPSAAAVKEAAKARGNTEIITKDPPASDPMSRNDRTIQ